jgi:hypothetical protein
MKNFKLLKDSFLKLSNSGKASAGLALIVVLYIILEVIS